MHIHGTHHVRGTGLVQFTAALLTFPTYPLHHSKKRQSTILIILIEAFFSEADTSRFLTFVVIYDYFSNSNMKINDFTLQCVCKHQNVCVLQFIFTECFFTLLCV